MLLLWNKVVLRALDYWDVEVSYCRLHLSGLQVKLDFESFMQILRMITRQTTTISASLGEVLIRGRSHTALCL